MPKVRGRVFDDAGHDCTGEIWIDLHFAPGGRWSGSFEWNGTMHSDNYRLKLADGREALILTGRDHETVIFEGSQDPPPA